MSEEGWRGLRGIGASLAFLLVFGLWALHWPHLQADFPNFSSWLDYSKYTDEGWYASGAIRSTLYGHWLLPGDFNPSIALPVWPALVWLVFQVTGVTPQAARGLALCVFAGNLLLSFAVLRAAGATRIGAWGGVLLLAASAYLWAFSRLAILEPLLTFWILAGFLLTIRLQPWQGARRIWALVGVGVLGCLAILTKTTAIFLLPATAWLVFRSAGSRFRAAARELALAFAGGLIPWLAYFFLVARRYSVDYHYLFSANDWDHPKSFVGWLGAFWYAAHGLLWAGPLLVCTTLALLALGCAVSPELRRSPLVQATIVGAAGYIFFTGWHNNPQPRYYMPLVPLVVFTAVRAAEALAHRSRVLAGAAAGVLLWIFAADVRGSVAFARHPEYTLRTAAQGLTAYIDSHPEGGKRMLLSISGDQISLFTHLPAICDDFGTDDLPARIQRYRPGWYAQWNELDPGTLSDIRDAGYHLRAVAHWHAFDDEDRDDLILYRMVPDPPSPDGS